MAKMKKAKPVTNKKRRGGVLVRARCFRQTVSSLFATDACFGGGLSLQGKDEARAVKRTKTVLAERELHAADDAITVPRRPAARTASDSESDGDGEGGEAGAAAAGGAHANAFRFQRFAARVAALDVDPRRAGAAAQPEPAEGARRALPHAPSGLLQPASLSSFRLHHLRGGACAAERVVRCAALRARVRRRAPAVFHPPAAAPPRGRAGGHPLRPDDGRRGVVAV